MYKIENDLEYIKKCLTNMYIAFNNLNNEDAKTNRSSELKEDILRQISSDRIFFNGLRNNALNIFDKCNKLMMSEYNIED